MDSYSIVRLFKVFRVSATNDRGRVAIGGYPYRISEGFTHAESGAKGLKEFFGKFGGQFGNFFPGKFFSGKFFPYL